MGVRRLELSENERRGFMARKVDTTALQEWRKKLDAGLVERKIPLGTIERHKADPFSLRKAINAKCLDCCGFQRA
jgi:hypothetical protein